LGEEMCTPEKILATLMLSPLIVLRLGKRLSSPNGSGRSAVGKSIRMHFSSNAVSHLAKFQLLIVMLAASY